MISQTRPSRSPEFVLLFSLFLTACLAGCDLGSPEYQAIDAPPLHFLDATLIGVDAGGSATKITLSAAKPVTDATELVQSTSSVVLRFDRFLLPGDAIRQSICLQPNSDPVKTLQDCTQQVFLEPSYDPVRRTVTYRLPATGSLIADTKYWLTILAPTEASTFGFHAFDGAALDTNTTVQFSTAVTNPPGGPVDPSLDEAAKQAVSNELFCVASACVASCGADDTCKGKCPVAKSLPAGCAGCHGPIEFGGSAMGLDLSAGNRIPEIIGRVANQTQTGANADEPDTKPRRFGRAMPQIEAGNPGNSYLLYKMLISPMYARSAAAAGIASGEIDRLRASVVVGLPMPPYEVYALPEASVDALSAWISTGAQTPVCP